MHEDPLTEGTTGPHRDPYDANSALPTLLFGHARKCLERKWPNLVVREVRRFSVAAYPLSGGFRSWSLLPRVLVIPLLRLERAVERGLGPLMAFRLLAVVEKI